MAEKTDDEIIKELGLEKTNTEDNMDNKENNNEEETNQNNDDLEVSNKTQDDNKLEPIDEDAIPVMTEEFSHDDADETKQRKQPKLFKILIGAVALLSAVLIIGLILYFVGFFDPEEPMKPKPAINKALEQKKKVETINVENIDKKRLNEKLKTLTKTQLLNKEELEAKEKKIQEEKKKEEEAKQKAIEEKKKQEEEKIAAQKAKLEEEQKLLKEHLEAIKKEQEAFIKLQEDAKLELEKKREEVLKELDKEKASIDSKKTTSMENTPIKEDTKKEEMSTPVVANDMQQEKNMNEQEKTASNTTAEIVNETIDNKKTFLQFINVATIKGELFKSYLDKIEKYGKNVELCRDPKNRIEIYFGPFDSDKERKKVFDNLQENGYKDAFLVDLTKEEYDKRCKY